MSFVLTKGTDDEYATGFAYVACAYACVARESLSKDEGNDDAGK